MLPMCRLAGPFQGELSKASCALARICETLGANGLSNSNRRFAKRCRQHEQIPTFKNDCYRAVPIVAPTAELSWEADVRELAGNDRFWAVNELAAEHCQACNSGEPPVERRFNGSFSDWRSNF